MKTFKVSVQVIKVYLVDVNADTEEEAIETAVQSQSTEIEEHGSLKNVETDHAEIEDEEDCEPGEKKGLVT